MQKHLFEMAADSAFADAEALRDVRIGLAFNEKNEDLSAARREFDMFQDGLIVDGVKNAEKFRSIMPSALFSDSHQVLVERSLFDKQRFSYFF